MIKPQKIGMREADWGRSFGVISAALRLGAHVGSSRNTPINIGFLASVAFLPFKETFRFTLSIRVKNIRHNSMKCFQQRAYLLFVVLASYARRVVARQCGVASIIGW